MEKKITKLKMIILDMDGVLLDSEPLHAIARATLFARIGESPEDPRFPPPTGRSSSGFWRQVMGICGIEGDPYDMEREQYRLVAKQIEENHVRPTEGLPEIFAWAKEQKLPVGLASSSTRVLVNDSLRLLGVGEWFTYTVSGDEAARKKPAPDIYEKVLALAGIDAAEAVTVEDSSTGVAAANAAGVYCFGYRNPTSGEEDLSGADEIVDNMHQVLARLKEMHN